MFKAFIQELKIYASDDKTENIYTGEFGEIRCNNIDIYLNLMHKRNPTTILVGEAPGYKGCRNTGIPFTDEYHMINGVNDSFILGEALGYKLVHNNSNLEKENSASIVWGNVGVELNKVIMWNIFPFHPFTGDKNSNRTPTVKEGEAGLRYLKMILNEFETINNIIAVGRVSEKIILADTHLDKYLITYVRHPANIGQRKFIEGIKNLLV